MGDDQGVELVWVGEVVAEESDATFAGEDVAVAIGSAESARVG
jgi:hypothetical protein